MNEEELKNENGKYASMPETYLVWSVLVTLFCCLPFGIVGIVRSSKVSTLWNTGRYEEAERASKKAKDWCIWGFVVGAAISAVYAFVEFVTIMNS